MAIYVDSIKTYPISMIQGAARRLGQRWCHMWTDGSEAELHRFAARIGLKKAWFQRKGSRGHYDLIPRRRAVAVKYGAVEEEYSSYLKRTLYRKDRGEDKRGKPDDHGDPDSR